MPLFRADWHLGRLSSLAHQVSWKSAPSGKAKARRVWGRAGTACQLLERIFQLQGDLESCFLWILPQMPPLPALPQAPVWLGWISLIPTGSGWSQGRFLDVWGRKAGPGQVQRQSFPKGFWLLLQGFSAASSGNKVGNKIKKETNLPHNLLNPNL